MITLSFLFMPPMSPCKASAALIKLEGEPVLDKVAEIFFATCPDFPTPRVIIFPFVVRSFSQTLLKSLVKVSARFSKPLDSIFIVLLPDLR